MRRQLLAGASAAAIALVAGSAYAADAGAASDTTSEVEEVVIYGKGESRQVQTIQPQEIERAAPGTSPIKLVEKLPGVNFQSADAFGSYEWSTRISIRGFVQQQLGFTLDGIPLGDMSYGNNNGLHISRAIMSEDLGGVELAQGAGSLETASTSNLGGALKFKSRAPSDQFGVLVALTGGSDNTTRGFVRIDSGELATGTRAYLSYANQKADKWKGQGEQKQQQADFKIVQAIGPANVTFFYDWSSRQENDYQDLSQEMIKRLGYGWDNNTGNWAQAVAIAKAYQAAPGGDCTTTVYPSPIKCVDDTYYDASGLRDDKLWGLSLDTPITDSLTVRGTLYGHKNEGQGTWFTPYVPSPNNGVLGATTDNAPISVRTTEYDISRTGILLHADWTLGAHLLSFGGWHEDNDFNQARRFYGLNLAAPQRSSLKFMRGPFFTQWAYSFNTKINQFYVQDVWTVTDALKVNFGFKSLDVKNISTTTFGAPIINGKIGAKDSFLPQVGVNYTVNDNNEVFAGYTENLRAFASSHTAGPFATTQAGFQAQLGKLRPETSKTLEAGWRFRTAQVQGVAAVYYVKFDDRLIGISAGAGIVGNPAILSNAGSVTSKGFETAVTWSLNEDWSLFGSYAYNDSQYDDDVRNAAGVITQRISGKTVVDTPKSLLNAEVVYDNGGWFAKANLHYTSKRFFTYTNDKSVPGVATVDLSAGYRFGEEEGPLKGLDVQLNITNLTDKSYVSTIGSNGFGFSGDNQTLLEAAPRQAFVTVRKQF